MKTRARAWEAISMHSPGDMPANNPEAHIDTRCSAILETAGRDVAEAQPT